MPKLYDNALITVSPLALVSIWGDLVEAYHGINSYGGHTAEIYAYRMMPYSPIVHSAPSPNAVIAAEIALRAANALCAIVDEFCTQFECEAQIDDVPLERWCADVNHGAHVFDHRCHVRIFKPC